MDILVTTIMKTNTFTLGELEVNNKYLCDTLEDRMRPDNQKVMHETAIPRGTYNVVLSYSPRFKQILPEIQNVPNFTGIRIHKGNNTKDTSGCLLVGYWDGEKADWIANSTKAFNDLFAMMKEASDKKEKITITFKDILDK